MKTKKNHTTYNNYMCFGIIFYILVFRCYKYSRSIMAKDFGDNNYFVFFIGVSIFVLIERIKEIRSGEDHDLSKY